MPSTYRYAADLDECSAIGLAIATHLNGLAWATGKTLTAVYPEWADAETVRQPPAVAVMPIDGGTYSGESGGFGPSPIEETWDPAFQAMLWQDGEFVTQVDLVVWATDIRMRSQVVRAIREAFQAREGATQIEPRGYGRVIPVARYFGGARPARVAPASIRFVDDPTEAEARHRVAYMTLNVQLPMLRVDSVLELEASDTVTMDGEAV